jgi:hypothetical protein
MEGPDRPTPGEYGGWYAWHYHGPLGPETLKVIGECEFPTPGYPSSLATQLCMGAYVPFARRATLGYFSLRSGEASRRNESRQFVSDLCPAPSTNRQQFIADSSRSLRCTYKQESPPSKCGHEVLGERKKNARQEM